MRNLLAVLLSLFVGLPLFAADVVKPAGEGAPIIAPIDAAKALPNLGAQIGVPGLPQAVVPAIPGAPENAAVDAPQLAPDAIQPQPGAPLARPELDAISPEGVQPQGADLGDLAATKIFDGAKFGVAHLHHDEAGGAHLHLESFRRNDREKPAPFPIPTRLEPYVPSARDQNPQDWTDKITLHLHSIYSDGTMTPEAVMEAAYKAGVRVVALTDHDTLSGIARAWQKVKEINAANPNDKMEFHVGVEMSANGGAHINAIDVDPTNPKLIALLETVRIKRHEKAEGIIANLNELDEFKQKGIVLTIDEVKAFSQHDNGGTIEIPHIARALLQRGLINSVDDAYDTYLTGNIFNTPGVAPDPTAKEVIDTIHDAGGKAFLNHPYTVRGKSDADKDAAVEEILELGADGIEAYRPSNATSDNGKRLADERTAKYLVWAEKYNLIVGNGADFHGTDTHLDHLSVWMHNKFADALIKALAQSNLAALAALAAGAAGLLVAGKKTS